MVALPGGFSVSNFASSSLFERKSFNSCSVLGGWFPYHFYQPFHSPGCFIVPDSQLLILTCIVLLSSCDRIFEVRIRRRSGTVNILCNVNRG